MNKLLSYITRPGYILERVLESVSTTKEVAWEKMSADGEALTAGFVEKPRVAVVKQDVYQDLYCCPAGTPAQETISSSLKRTGPVALFTRLDADFWIVKTEEDPECNIWKEKCTDCRQNDLAYYEALKTEVYLNGARGHEHAQGEFSVQAGDVDWNRYDIVISFDISVPSRITRLYENTVWCYILGEPCMSSYGRSHTSPIKGYDLFLNQRFRCLPSATNLAKHEVEFPYYLQYFGCFEDLYGAQSGPRDGVMIESHTDEQLSVGQKRSLAAFGSLRTTCPKTEDTVFALLKSKYFVRLGGRKLWGNAMIEAIAAGCLVIGNPDEYKHRGLFTADTSVSTFDELLSRIESFERDSAALERTLSEQRKRLDYLCFDRPMLDLCRATDAIMSKRRLGRQDIKRLS